MQISLIISTYNWKEALHLSIESALKQTLLPQEIVVADDGSRPDTAALIQRLAASSPIPILHSWQEDAGFRAAKSRNQAIAKAQGNYLVCIDGDMLLDRHFVADHHAYAQEGFFVQGPRALLSPALTTQTLHTGTLQIPYGARGMGNKKNCVRSALLTRLFSHTSKRLSGIRLCNFACWKADVLQVNGFNEAFIGWGREDSEFAARLLHAGIRRKNVRFHALGYHLHHAENSREMLASNDRILQQTLDAQRTWCDQGLDQYLT
jgi:glycosyltransferase involved in cell wall biosynthesis